MEKLFVCEEEVDLLQEQVSDSLDQVIGILMAISVPPCLQKVSIYSVLLSQYLSVISFHVPISLDFLLSYD